jgi:hypothetical protein
MTREDRIHNWRRLAKATTYLLDSPESSCRIVETLATFCDSILPEERAGAFYGRRLIAHGEMLAGPKSTEEDPIEVWCTEFGDALYHILKDERTPDCVGEAADRLFAELDRWAEEREPQSRRNARAQQMLPELLILASFDDEEMGPPSCEEQQSDAVM